MLSIKKLYPNPINVCQHDINTNMHWKQIEKIRFYLLSFKFLLWKIIDTKVLRFCHKLYFSNIYIFATQDLWYFKLWILWEQVI